MLTLNKFHAALDAGDVAAIASYFASDAGLAHVRETEQRVAARVRGRLQLRAWHVAYTRQGPQPVLLEKAICSGHYEVIEWLFNYKVTSHMQVTLTQVVLPHTCVAAMRAEDVFALEIVLTPRVFTALLSSDERQSMLGSLLASPMAVKQAEVMELLLAHGAVEYAAVGLSKTLTMCTTSATLDQVDVFLRNGAFAVGLETRYQPVYFRQIQIHQRLIQCGADVAHGGVALRSACQGVSAEVAWVLHVKGIASEAGVAAPAARVDVPTEAARVLLAEGFADVDARDDRGQTPWQIVSPPPSTDGARHQQLGERLMRLPIRQLLLEYGASTAHDVSN